MLTITDIPARESRVELELSSRRNAALAAAVHSPNPKFYDDEDVAASLGHPGVPFLLYFQALETGTPTTAPLTSVQAWVDLQLIHQIKVGDRLTSVGSVSAIGELPPGAAFVRRFDISNESGEVTAELRACALVPGAKFAQPNGGVGSDWEWLDKGVHWTTEFRVELWDPNIFAECTGTFNQIHLSKSAAVMAGLTDRPYQGIATLLRASAQIVERELGGLDGSVKRLAAVFRKPVFPGETVRVVCVGRKSDESGRSIFFRAIKADGTLALERGVVAAH